MNELKKKTKCIALSRKRIRCSNDAVDGTNYCKMASHKAQGIIPNKNKGWFQWLTPIVSHPLVTLIVIIISVLGLYFGWVACQDKFSGELTPDSKANPPNFCNQFLADKMGIIMGKEVAYTNKFPQTIITIKNQPVLTLNKIGGLVTVSGNFFSKDGKIVAELKNNRFTVNANNSFHLEHPNKHTLIVYNQENEESLNVEFLNNRVISLLGRMYYPNNYVLIDKNFLEYNGQRITSEGYICIGGQGPNNAFINLD